MSTRSPIPNPEKGQSVLMYIKKLIKYVEAMRIVPGDGLVTRESAKGTVISLALANRNGANVEPFAITGGSGLTAKLAAGTVTAFYGTSTSAEYPTYSGTALNADPTPTLTLTGSATNYIYIKGELTAAPSGATVQYRYDATDPMTIDVQTSTQADTGDSYAGTAGTAYWLLGTVVTSGSAVTSVNQQWTGDLAYAWTNMGHYWGGA